MDLHPHKKSLSNKFTKMITTKMVKRGQNLVTSLLMTISILYFPIKLNAQNDTGRMKSVTILGRFEEQQKALEYMKNADNILNVISSQQIKLFPDINAAEAIQRISGITLQRDHGEGRFVQLRGTPPQLTNFNINGEQIPSPEGDVRFVGLDVIAADQIERIEVTKALTADMDGDGIGGTVNVVTKTAKETTPKISIAVNGGYNNIRNNRNNFMGMFSFSQRIGNHGFVFGANRYQNIQGSHNMEFNYTKRPTQQDNVFQPVYNDIELRYYEIQRDRTGLNASYTYYIRENSEISIRAMFNSFTDDEQRHRLVYEFGGGTIINPTKTREATLLRDLRNRTKTQEINTINLDGKHNWERWKIDYGIALSHATEDVPNQFEIGFTSPNLSFSIDRSEPNWPKFKFASSRDSSYSLDYQLYKFDGLQTSNSVTTSNNRVIKFNVTHYLNKNEKRNEETYFKTGAKWRHKTKSRDVNGYSYDVYWSQFAPGTRQIYTQIGPKLSLATVGDDLTVTNLLNRGYDMGNSPSVEKSSEFFKFYYQNFKLNESDTKDELYSSDYSATEDIYAGYLMFKHQKRNWSVQLGLRSEFTDVDYNGYFFKTYKGRFFDTLEKLNSSRNYFKLLPMMHLKYTLNRQTNLRFAFTKTYSRPNFEDILPYKKEQEGGLGDEIKFGNPNLRFPDALNFDLLFEHYMPQKGLLQGGIFYKYIDQFVFLYKRFVHLDSNFSTAGLKEVTMAQNGLFAHVYGAEITYNNKFHFLPGIWRNLGIYSNYTYTASEAFINERVTVEKLDEVFIYGSSGNGFVYTNNNQEKLTLPGQAKHSVNLGLFYDSKKLFIQAILNYHDDFLNELGQENTFDTYYGAATRIDLTADYRFKQGWNMFLQANNLTNTPLTMYLGSPDLLKQKEYYSWWFRFGIRHQW
jgi:TonB-dependent receptor